MIGASGGIGCGVAKYFLENSFRVIGTNFKDDFQPFLLNNPNFIAHRLDVTSLESLKSLSKKIGEVQAIVNCSGVVDFEAYAEPTKNLDIWNSTIAVNLTGSYLIFEYLNDNIISGGSYVMISSTDSYFGGKVNRAYAVSKAGINSLTKSLSLLVKESGVRVNAIAPGWVETAMMEAGGDELVEYAKQINPLQRNGTPREVAELADFLISPKSGYINGQVINLDGGYILQDPTLVFEEQQLDK